MNPASLALFIPILALGIPIIAIIADAYKKSHRNNPEQERRILALEKKIQVLEDLVDGKLTDMRSDMAALEEKQQFIQRLLDKK